MTYHVYSCRVCGSEFQHHTNDAHVCSTECHEASVFTEGERATRIQVDEVGFDSPLVASLGEIHAANGYDAEVRDALRALLNGAPSAMVGGGAFGLFSYRLADSEAGA